MIERKTVEVSFNHHVPVLLNEVLEFVDSNVTSKYTFIDMTLGRAGHSKAIIDKLNNKNLVYFGIDRDNEALNFSKEKLSKCKGHLNFIKSTFKDATEVIFREYNVSKADLILFDIGVSSPQFDDPRRGFSYRQDSKLDMRMDQNAKLTAYDVVNTYSLKELSNILSTYGDEKYAYQIAKKIVETRQSKPIETTFQLVDVIKNAIPKKELFKEHHPAKKTFMAIRYEVNNELEELTEGLEKAIKFLNEGGKLLIITFNSTEDRIVKNLFKKYTQKSFINKYVLDDGEEIEYSLLTKKPIAPSEAEVNENSRSKPSKLRVITKNRRSRS